MALPSDISFLEGDLLFLAAIAFIVYSNFEVTYAVVFSFANLLLKNLLSAFTIIDYEKLNCRNESIC